MRDRRGTSPPQDVANAAVPDADREWFERLLTERYPTPTPTLAAPGLSRHGRMQAVDFQVRRTSDGATVAGPVSANVDSVWRVQGWADRLHRAVISSGAHLRGPLQVPAEPWHYEVVAGGQ